jgi:neutral ceramidase
MKHQIINILKTIWCLIITFLLNSCAVVKTPYFKTDYYKNTVARLDSMKPDIKPDQNLYAGFSRVSITPDLNRKYDTRKEQKQNNIPLAGYGNRKGKPAEGIHDSVFVKAVALKSDEKTIIIVSADLQLNSFQKMGLRESSCFLQPLIHIQVSVAGDTVW